LNGSIGLLLKCKKALRGNDAPAVANLLPDSLKEVTSTVETMIKSKYYNLVESPDKV
jgi:hypothetical protein